MCEGGKSARSKTKVIPLIYQLPLYRSKMTTECYRKCILSSYPQDRCFQDEPILQLRNFPPLDPVYSIPEGESKYIG